MREVKKRADREAGRAGIQGNSSRLDKEKFSAKSMSNRRCAALHPLRVLYEILLIVRLSFLFVSTISIFGEQKIAQTSFVSLFSPRLEIND